MKRVNLFAAAAIATALLASPVLATEVGGQNSGHSKSVEQRSPNLGIDMSAAGTTPDTRMAFWKQMPATDQQSVSGACADESKRASFTTDETAFCEIVPRT